MQVDLSPTPQNVVAQINTVEAKRESNEKATTVTPIENSSASFLRTLDRIVTQARLERIENPKRFFKQFYLAQTPVTLSDADLVRYTPDGNVTIDAAKGQKTNLVI